MSLETVANITLGGNSAPKSLSISEQAFLNFNILRIRDSLGITQFFSDPSLGAAGTPADALRGPTCLNTDDPTRIVSEMNNQGDDSIFRFLTMNNLEIATLQPKIELRKIIYSSEAISSGEPIYEGIIPFKTNSEVTNVTFQFKNQNPLGAGRMVDVKIELVLSQGISLTTSRSLSQGERMADSPLDDLSLSEFRYTDLFLRPYDDATSYNRNAYQIRANFGWKTEDSSKYKEQLGADNYSLYRDILETQEVSLNLLLVNYDLSFRQDGKLSLVLDYISTLEDSFEDNRTNIFHSGMGNLMGESTSADLVSMTEELNRILPQVQEAERLEALLSKQMSIMGAGAGGSAGAIGAASILATSGTSLVDRWTAAHNAINDPTTGRPRVADLQRRIAALGAGLVLSEDGTANTVLMHSKLLKHIHESGRLFSFIIPKHQLIYYSENYQKNLMGSNPNLFFDALTEVENISDTIFGTSSTSPSTSHFFKSRGTSVPNFASELTNQLMALPEINNDPGRAAGASGNNLAQAYRGMEAGGRAFAFDSVFGTSTGYRDPNTVSDDQNHTFYFFFYGDLIAAAMGLHQNQMSRQMIDEKIGIILNSILYTRDYPIPPVVPDDPSIAPGARTTPPEEININLAHVPITLDSYFNFFKENIVDKKRDKMPIGDFVRETLTKLVSPALNTKSFGTQPREKVLIKANMVEVSRTPLVYSDGAGGTTVATLDMPYDPLLTLIQPLPVTSSTSSTPTSTTASIPTSFSDFDPTTRVYNKFSRDKARMKRLNKYKRFSYLNCYGVSKSSMNSGLVAPRYRGSFINDRRSGIYHLSPASQNGLVKDIKFSKRAIRYLSEASVFSQTQGTATDGFTRLWNVFDAEIVMVGNNLFVPGSLLYINTSNTGLGNPSSQYSVSKALGLGGYYLVISVDNQIVQDGAGMWETVVKAIWQSSGRNY